MGNKKYSIVSYRTVFVLAMLLLCASNGYSQGFMQIHPCRVMVDDSLCYLVREGYSRKNKHPWEIFCGKFKNYYYQEGYSHTMHVEKYDLKADTIHVIKTMSRLSSDSFYDLPTTCDCDKFRKEFAEGKKAEECDCPTQNRMGLWPIMTVYPCRVKLGDSLCYLVKRGHHHQSSLFPLAGKWEFFGGEIQYYRHEEGVYKTLLVEKYDLTVDTIRMVKVLNRLEVTGDCEEVRKWLKKELKSKISVISN